MNILLLALYLWICRTLHQIRGNSFLPSLLEGGSFTPHGVLVSRSQYTLFVTIGWVGLLVALQILVRWMDSTDWMVPLNGVLISILFVLDFSAISLIPQMMQREIHRLPKDDSSTPNLFSEENYPILWTLIIDPVHEQALQTDPDFFSPWHSTVFSANPQIRRCPASHLSQIRQVIPEVPVLLMSVEWEHYLLHTWSKMSETIHRQAEKALHAQEAERVAKSAFDQIRLEVDKLKESNRALHQQLIALRNRRRGEGIKNFFFL